MLLCFSGICLGMLVVMSCGMGIDEMKLFVGWIDCVLCSYEDVVVFEVIKVEVEVICVKFFVLGF